MRRILTVGLVSLCAVGIAFALYYINANDHTKRQLNCTFLHKDCKGANGGHDSPIEVAGGSIHGSAECNGDTWAPTAGSSNTSFGADSNGYTALMLHGMNTSSPDFNVATASSGWLLLIFASGNSTPTPNLSFCSDTTQWTGFVDCHLLTQQDPNESVYLQANNNSDVAGYLHRVHDGRDLHFHNTTGTACDAADTVSPAQEPAEGNCDRMDKVEVVTRNTTPPIIYSTVTYTCADEMDCLVRVGK